MEIKNLYFCGIGGIAMSAVAVMFKRMGFNVIGSDVKLYNPARDFLNTSGIEFFEGYKAENILQSNAQIFIISNAISRGNPEVEAILDHGLKYISMPEFLKQHLLCKRKNIVVSGTHGKTTIASLIAHILDEAELDPGFMIGGLPGNFDCSASPGKDTGYFVLEGDEYDTYLFDKRSKFFHYLPSILAISNIEFDHLDIFKNLEQIKQSFSLMLRQIPKGGYIVVNGDDEIALSVAKTGFSNIVTFGTLESCDSVISDIQFDEVSKQTSFKLKMNDETVLLKSKLIGEFNVRNIAAACIIAKICDISWDKISQSLQTFIPSLRRLTKLTNKDLVNVFDDFAHHPTAIYEGLKAVRNSYQGKLTVVFEPRSFTSVSQYHQKSLPKALTQADRVIIWPSNKWHKAEFTKRLDLDRLIQDIGPKALVIENKENIIHKLKEEIAVGENLVFMSQSDLDALPLEIAKYFDNL